MMTSVKVSSSPLICVEKQMKYTHVYTVEYPKREQYGDEPFVLSREFVLFQRFL